MDISIIIPTYNESKRILPTLASVHQYCMEHNFHFEILIVDDGSTDDTISTVQAMNLSRVAIIKEFQNRGKGYAVRKGMLAAKGAIRLFCDADGSTPIIELEKLVKPLLAKEASIAIGSRYVQGAKVTMRQPLLRRVWSRGVNNVVQKKLLPGIIDTHCGFKAFSHEAAIDVFSKCTINGWAFDLEVLALAQLLKYSIVEIPVMWQNDAQSKAKLRQLPKEVYNFMKIKRSINRYH